MINKLDKNLSDVFPPILIEESWQTKSEDLSADSKMLYYIKNALEAVGGIKQLAQITGVSERTVYAWKNGTRYPSRRNMAHMEKIIKNTAYNASATSQHLLASRKKNLSQSTATTLTPQPITNPDFLLVGFHPQPVDSNISAQPVHEGESWPFMVSWLNKLTPHLDSLCLFSVSGRCMEPILSAGDICLIDCQSKRLEDDKVYLLRVKDSLYLRRFFQTPDNLYFRCDCQDFAYQDINIAQARKVIDGKVIGGEALDWEVIGLVIWVGKTL